MTLFGYFWLTLGLLILLTQAAETTTADESTATAASLLKIWGLDSGCDTEIEYLEDSMSIALDIATAAHEALEFVAGPMPDEATQKERLNRWKSIYKSCVAFLGFLPAKQPNYLREVTALFAKMKRTIPADQGDPAHGYVYGLRDLPNAKPKLMCGEKAVEEKWKWYSVTDTLPGEHVPISGMEKYKEIAFEYPGAWVFDHRLIWADNEDERPTLCQPGWLGVVLWDKDIVAFCDEMFEAQAKAIKSPREWKKSGIVAGAQLNDYNKNHLSVIIVHELCHWFGGAVRDARGIPGAIIDDQTAIDGRGRTLYKLNDRIGAYDVEPSPIKAAEKGLQRVAALLTAWCSDGCEKVFTLAMCKDKENKNYCGPEKAVKNADSLALFALAMYYDQWDCPRWPGAERKERERNERWEARVKELTLLPDPRPRALTPDPNPLSSSNISAASASGPRPRYQGTCFWFRVPPNIRRDILRLAFGDTRIHINLEYGRPHIARPETSNLHCGIVVGPGEYPGEEVRVVDETKPAAWRWWSSRCHRSYPDETKGQVPMTRGGASGPWLDYCRDGGESGICEAWKEKEGSLACHVGVMGWLLSCRQNYMETIDVLYSTNTLILQGSRMIIRLPQLLLPQRLATVTSLEVTWPFKTNYTADQDYDDLDQDHFRSVLDLLLPSQFPALRRLYIEFHDGQECFLGIHGLEVYKEIILRELDSFAQRMTHLTECAFALPDYFFRSLHYKAKEEPVEGTDGIRFYYSRRSYQQVWRDFNGNMAVVVLPYVDSYPKPPYQVLQEGEQAAGYWILEASDEKIIDSRDEPVHWCGSSLW
ncbi:hypothetical protein FPANT_5548 [Fusarium pseudoanthophilum]|uniref:DUF7730 domain-containing protein n=1 Tax=Fusarium pseudoanthophilum TaxID=48495 RepID=A0A8H5P8B9_9HYPO|nr:hypothetical protein FPANT_5548 [Fusarium pseudoanthophilum]